MKEILITVFDLTAFICGKVLGSIYSIREQQIMQLFRNRVFSYSIAGNFKEFGKGASVAHNVVLLNPKYVTIGDDSSVGYRTVVTAWDIYGGEQFTPCITIGRNTRIGADCHLTAINTIVIGDGVLLGNKITITDNGHGSCTADQLDISPIKRRMVSKGAVTIEDNVWVGDKATILSGVRIGFGSIIAANAVVCHDVPPGCVVAGVPARIVKRIL